MKNSFMLYIDQYEPIQTLSLEQKGRLLDAFFAYNMGEEVSFDDPVLAMAFAFFKQAFERDNANYERKCKKNKENIEKRYSKSTNINDGNDGIRSNTNATYNYNDPDINLNTHTLTSFECVSKSELSDPAPPKSEKEKNPIVELTDDDASSQGKVPACPQKSIVEAYHEILVELPCVRTWRANSATALRTRWREKWKEGKFADVNGGIGYFRRFFEYVRKSDFLMGRTTGRDGRCFVCTLVWMLQARHFDDIVAGKYHDPDREAA